MAPCRAPEDRVLGLLEGHEPFRATVMGLGLFGGGLGAARFLAGRGAQVTVTDLKGEASLAESLQKLPPRCRLVLGRHEEADFRGTNLVVANPAVRPDSPFLAVAREAGVPVETEISLFLRFCPAPSLGVTGSNGKTTTTSLLAHMLQSAGWRTHLGGNVGGSLLESLGKIAPADRVVLELSSFQLHYLGPRDLGPRGGVVTNLTPNHLDWHVTMDHYEAAKREILRRAEWAVLNVEDACLGRWTAGAGVIRYFGTGEGTSAWEADGHLWLELGGVTERLLPCAEVPLPGRFNRLNILAAALAARLEGAPTGAVAEAVRSFRAVPHRLELVAEWGGRRFFNDSVSTTPESTRAALEAFPQSPLVVLVGGRDKGCALEGFLEDLAGKACGVVFMGEIGPRLLAEYTELPLPRKARAVLAGRFEEAFELACSLAPEGAAVVLSPGFPSYDWFRNFVERGERFRQLARAGAERAAGSGRLGAVRLGGAGVRKSKKVRRLASNEGLRPVR
ncbi:MAG: UDP-N-acetylmuramoyl-L-alanine--D-glutamate ligase [Planctomycetota bacterium]